MLKSKTKWLEEGEKKLLNLEKQNYCNKLITNLEMNGKIIKEQRNIAEVHANY